MCIQRWPVGRPRTSCRKLDSPDTECRGTSDALNGMHHILDRHIMDGVKAAMAGLSVQTL